MEQDGRLEELGSSGDDNAEERRVQSGSHVGFSGFFVSLRCPATQKIYTGVQEVA
jgi:hypothetical protein